jgi:hypothetical protein
MTEKEMETDTIPLDRLAKAMLHQLDSHEQAQVHETLAMLATLAPDRWPTIRVTEFPEGEKWLLIPVNDQLRLIVQVADGEPPFVVDLVRQERLDALAKLAARTGK